MIDYAEKEYVRKLEARINRLEKLINPETRKVEWYENIPEGGVLCWCSFGGSDKKYTDIIKRYGSKKEKFITDYNEYAKAEPLTKQEIQTYLDNAPEE